jgi:hypothetical protein
MNCRTSDIGRRTSVAVIALLLSASGAAAQTQLLIVSGIGGDPKYTQGFAELSTALAQGAQARAGLADSAVMWLGDPAATKSKWYRGPSTRASIETTLARLAAGDANEQLVLILIGHGSGEGAETRVSLPGPDATAADFARMLGRFGDRRVAFINLTSASGDMLPLVSSPTRVVMTATKSAFERNESQFGRFFVDALSKEGADTDKDARISLLEAFRYAEAETKRFYETQGRLATEHPQMADEGQLARRFFLSPGSRSGPASNAQLSALYSERNALDAQIEALRKRKASMAEDAYDKELERLLIALAEKTQAIKALEKGS